MKFSKRNLLIAVMVAVILFLLVRRGVSLASEMAAPPAAPVPANCNPVAIDAMISCATMYPSFPLAGDMIDGGKKKYCCKSS
jgi:hypothetical protein